MEKLLFGLILLAGCAGPCFQADSDVYATDQCRRERIQNRLDVQKWAEWGRRLNPNTYGLPNHTQHLGQGTLQPAYGNAVGGNYSNSYIQTPNAYGPGIHMDQYGRAVTY